MLSHMHILQGRNARSDLPMSNAARKQLGIQAEVVRNNVIHAVLPTHDLNVGQQVMYQDSVSEGWYPAIIDSSCPKPRSLKINTRHGITYRKAQSHLKPFTPQNNNLQSNQCMSPPMAQSNNMLVVKTEPKKRSQVNNFCNFLFQDTNYQSLNHYCVPSHAFGILLTYIEIMCR